jgi:hypothetical protein
LVHIELGLTRADMAGTGVVIQNTSYYLVKMVSL